MGDEIPACPECDSTSIRSTQNPDKPGGWKCDDPECDSWFDEPNWRERYRNTTTGGGDTIASVLDAMDPDDLSASEVT